MKTSLTTKQLVTIMRKLGAANRAFSRTHPGDRDARQPVHTVYGGAHLFKADTAAKMGAVALRTLEEYAPADQFAAALGMPDDELSPVVRERVLEKLRREPVEDFRLDFEDGYGNRPDEEEDATAESAAGQVAQGMRAGTLPPFIGIRIKPMNAELCDRAVRTLDIFLTALCERTGRKLPANFVVTLPKPTIPEQVSALADLLGQLEKKLRLPVLVLKLELMIETPQSLFNGDGRCNLRPLLTAAKGRCVAAHFGVYDFTASNDITAAHQQMTHGACDFARHLMKNAYAGTGLWLSDGATNIMPIGPHRPVAPGSGTPLGQRQREENRAAVHRAWRLSGEHIRHSLSNGYYQGWDLHPAQLPVRYATVYRFFLEGLEAASLRLRSFMDKAAQATLVGDVFDDAATGQALLNYFLRALGCGAITEDEALRTGLTLAELRSRSFVKILAARRG